MDIELAQALAENELLKSLLYCTKRSCNNCGKVTCENFQRQRIDCCGKWVSYKDYITELEQQIEKMKCYQAYVDKQEKRIAELEDKLANADYQLEGRDIKIKELEAQIEKVKHYLDYDIPHDLINEATTKIWRMLK